MTTNGEYKKTSPNNGGSDQTIECLILDGDRLFCFDSSRMEKQTGIETDTYYNLEEWR